MKNRKIEEMELNCNLNLFVLGYPQNFKRRSPSPMFMNQNHEPSHWNGQV